MIDLFYISLIIIGLFFILLFFKKLLSLKKFCVLCASVSLTWVYLLVLFWVDIFLDKIIIALLIGQSILGIFYLVEEKVSEKLKLFRLPFLLTLIFIGYFLLMLNLDLKIIGLLLVLWILFFLLYLYKDNKKINKFVNKIIECCKRW